MSIGEADRAAAITEASISRAGREPVAVDAVFPLPMVPFERYMCVDHRAGYPMAFVVAADLRGEMDRGALADAVDTAIERHPLLSARVEGHGRKARWVPIAENPRPLRWHDDPPSGRAFQGEAVDLSRAPGFCVDAFAADGRTKLVLSFHHAACDGLGGVQVLGDLLAQYGILTATGKERPRLLPVDQRLTPLRGTFDLKLPAPVSRWQATKALLVEGWKVIGRRPKPLRAQRNAGEPHTARGELLQETVSLEDWQAFNATAARLDITANDLLLRDFFLSIREWQGKKARGWLRVTVPTSLRARRDLRMPAVNMIGYGLVARRATECDQSPEFLSTLARDTEFLRRWGIGSFFNYGVYQVDRVPGFLWLLSRLSRSFATSCLSNVGDPLRRFRAKFPVRDGLIVAGNVVLERLAGAPPVRPGTRLSVAVNAYGGRLTLSAQFDPRYLSAEAATEFLQVYRDHVTRTAQGQ